MSRRRILRGLELRDYGCLERLSLPGYLGSESNGVRPEQWEGVLGEDEVGRVVGVLVDGGKCWRL